MNSDTHSIFNQLEQISSKIFFLYRLDMNTFEHLSKAVEPVWEISKERILADPALLHQLVHPDDKETLMADFAAIKQGQNSKCKVRLLFKDGLVKIVQIDAYPIRDESGVITAIAGIAEEATGRFQYEGYLEKYAHRKNTALELIVHDLRVPLAHVKSATQLLESELKEKAAADVSTYTDIILNAYDQCIALILDVLADEHLKSPTIYVRKKRVEVVQLVEELVHNYSTHEGIEVKFEVLAEGKIYAELDDSKFMQILNNLVSNSLKFTRPEGKITISCKKEGRNLLITHSDTGIGIPEKLKPFIFTRYSKAKRTGLNGEPTVGIGLAIVRELVEIQGGHIRFDSKEEEGTTFYLSFPLSDN